MKMESIDQWKAFKVQRAENIEHTRNASSLGLINPSELCSLLFPTIVYSLIPIAFFHQKNMTNYLFFVGLSNILDREV